MAVTTSTREVDARRVSRSEEVKERFITPLHLSCGACAYCADTCSDAACVECARMVGRHEPHSSRIRGCDSIRCFTMCEIQRHNKEKSAWLVAGDDIYDATNYVNQHPGGKVSILKKSGGAWDCTEDFYFHSKGGRSVWKKYHVGKVKQCPGPHGNANSRQWWMFWM
jgi:hypothetical protein